MKTYTIQEFDASVGWGRKKKVTRGEYVEYMLTKGYCPDCIKEVKEGENGSLHCVECGVGWSN